MSKKVFSIQIIAGTRPEIIKLAPVYLALKAVENFSTKFIVTGQHRELATPFLEVFNISPDLDLNLINSTGLVGDILGKMVSLLTLEFSKSSADLIIVQGDTSSALAGALAGFHQKIPIAHVEAGLRTFDFYSPFPEEMNRVIITRLANLHFAPTARAVNNLLSEGIKENVHLTGNTGVDALNFIREKLTKYQLNKEVLNLLSSKDRFILSTFHRRENQEKYFEQFLNLLPLVSSKTGLKIVIPVHVSPVVNQTIYSRFSNFKEIILLPAVDYPSLIALMGACEAIISDSGGIQEEAPSFGKHVFITRVSTERPEVIESGYGELLDLENPEASAERINKFIQEAVVNTKPNPFGDGRASIKIADIITKYFAQLDSAQSR